MLSVGEHGFCPKTSALISQNGAGFELHSWFDYL